MNIITALCLTALVFTTPALAQETPENRISLLEQEVLLLKRQLERASATGSIAAAPADGGIATAQMEVRMSALEEQLRDMRGKVEEVIFAQQQLREELTKFKEDTEFRFNSLERPGNPTPPPVASSNSANNIELSVKDAPTPAAPAAPVVTTTPPTNPAASITTDAGQSPRDFYNYSFRLLNQNQYEEAAKNFDQFTKKYPNDPLVGNAYYWQGETYYIRKDYEKAAALFQKGYEVMPKGPKAPDNLLKLGMSLAALKKKEEACVVLEQVKDKYRTDAANVAKKAEAEYQRVRCQ